MPDLALGSVSLEVKLDLSTVQSDVKRAIEAAGRSIDISAFSGLLDAVKSNESALKKLNIEVKQFEGNLTNIGSSGKASFTVLSGLLGDAIGFYKQMNLSIGATGTAFKESQTKGTAFLKDLQSEAGKAEKAFSGIVSSTKTLEGAFSGLDEPLKGVKSSLQSIAKLSLGDLAKESAKLATAAEKVEKAWDKTKASFVTNTQAMEAQANSTGKILVDKLNHSAADTVAAAWRRTSAVFRSTMATMQALADRTGKQLVGSFDSALDRIRAMFNKPIGELSIGGITGLSLLRDSVGALRDFTIDAYKQMGGALLSFTGKALGEASKISGSLNVVKSLTGGGDTGELQKAIVQAGIASTQETGQIAKYTEQLARSGMAQKDISLALKPIALLADASGEEIGKTGKAVIAAGNAYQLGTDKLAQTSSTLLAAATSSQGATIAGYGKFSQYFKVQSEQGVKGLQTSAQIYSLLKSAGAEDAAAGRNIASFYKALGTPTKANTAAQSEINEILKASGSQNKISGFNDDGSRRSELTSLLETVKAYRELRTLKGDQTAQALIGKSMGVEALRQIVALANQSEEKIAATLDTVNRKIATTDLVGAFYKQATSGLAGAQKLLTGAMDGFTADYGLSLSGAAGTITGVFAQSMAGIASNTKIFEPLRSISKEFEDFAKDEKGFNSFTAGLTDLGSALLTMGVEGAIEIFRDLQSEFADLGDSTQTLGVLLQIPLRGFLLITGGIKNLIVMTSQITKTFRSLFSGEAFGGGENPLLSMFGPDLKSGVDGFGSAIGVVWDALRDGLGLLGPPILSAIGTAFKLLGDVVGAIAPYFATFIRYFSAITSVGIYQASAAFKILASVLSPVLSVIKGVGLALAEVGKFAFNVFSVGIKNAFRGFFDIGNAIDKFLGNPLRNAVTAFGKFVNGIGQQTKGVSTSLGIIGGTIASLFVSPQKAILALGKSLSNIASLKRFGDVGKGVSTMFEVVAAAASKSFANIRLPAFGAVKLPGVGNPFSGFKAPDFSGFKAPDFSGVFKGFQTAIEAARQSLEKAFGPAFKGISQNVNNITTAFAPIVKVLGEIGLGLGKVVLSVAQVGFGILAGAANIAFQGVLLAVNSAIGVLQALGAIVGGVVTAAFRVLQGVATVVFQVIGIAITGFTGAISAVGYLIQGDFTNAFRVIRETVESQITQVKAIFGTIADTVSAVLQIAMSTVQGVLNAINQAVAALTLNLQSIFNQILLAMQGVVNAIGVAWTTVLSAIGTGWNNFSALIQGGIANIQAFWNAMCLALGQAFSSIAQGIQDALTNIRNTIANVTNAISGGLGSAVSGLIGIFNGVKSSIESWMIPINKVIDGLKSAGRAIGDYTEQAGKAVSNAVASIPNPFAGIFGFANGGVLPGYSRTDDQLIMARSGEGIIVPEAVNLLGGAQGIDRLNRAAEQGSLPRFAAGGIVGSTNNSTNTLQLQGILKAIGSITKSFPELQQVLQSLGSAITPSLLTKLGEAIGKLPVAAKKALTDIVSTQLTALSSGGSKAVTDVARSLGSSSTDANKTSLIIREAQKQGLTKAQIAYVLATAQHESDQFRTMTEYASGADYEGRSDLGNTQAGDGTKYKGRGFVQLTGRANYTKYAQKLGIDLINNPQLAEVPEIAVKILVDGMKSGAYTGAKLSDFGASDYEGMRAIVNGSDRAGLIAGYARQYATALTSIGNISNEASKTTLDALQTIANAAKNISVSGTGNLALGGINAALARIPTQYRQQIEAVLSGATKTLPTQLAQWLSQVIPGITTEPISMGSSNAAKIVATARSWVGKEFNPGVFAQCAAFVRDIFKQSGNGLAETLSTSADGENYGVLEAGSLLKSSIGQVIRDKSKVMAGDILVWSKTYGDFGEDITHTGIATGNGMMIDRSTSSAPVRERAIDTFGNFVAAIRPGGTVDKDLNINAKALSDGLKTLGSKIGGLATFTLQQEKKSAVDTLQAAIDKLNKQKSELAKDATNDRYQARLEIETKDLAALKTKNELALKERVRRDRVALENAKLALSRATTVNAKTTAQKAIDDLIDSQPIALDKLKVSQAESQRKAIEALDRVKALISDKAAKDGLSTDISQLQDLQQLQKDFFDKKISESQLQAKLVSLGLTVSDLGDKAVISGNGLKGLTDKTVALIPTMQSLMSILQEGLKNSIELAKQFRGEGNQIQRQLQRLDLSDSQRINALPAVYRALIMGGNSNPISPNFNGGGNTSTPPDINIRFDVRSIGNEQYVPLSQATQAVNRATQAVSDSAYRLQNSYADRLANGIG